MRVKHLSRFIQTKEYRRAGKVRKLEDLDRQIEQAEAAIRAAEEGRERLAMARESTWAEKQELDEAIEHATAERARAFQEAANGIAPPAASGSRQAPEEAQDEPLRTLDKLSSMVEGHPERETMAALVQTLRASLRRSAMQPETATLVHRARGPFLWAGSAAAASAGETDAYVSGLEEGGGWTLPEGPRAAVRAAPATSAQAREEADQLLQQYPTPYIPPRPPAPEAPVKTDITLVPPPAAPLQSASSAAALAAAVPPVRAGAGEDRTGDQYDLGLPGRRFRRQMQKPESAGRGRSRDRERRRQRGQKRGGAGPSPAVSPMETDTGTPSG